MSRNRSSIFLHLLMRKLDEGATFADATDWALSGVQAAYQAIRESAFPPPALESVASSHGRRRADAA